MILVSRETWHRVCIRLHADVKLLFYIPITCTDKAEEPGDRLHPGKQPMSVESRASFRVLLKMKSAAERRDALCPRSSGTEAGPSVAGLEDSLKIPD